MAKINAKELKDTFRQHTTDTGSVEVQIIALTARIEELTGHIAVNPKDFSTKLGLIKLVSKRRKFLSYIKKHNEIKYAELIKGLGLRK